MKVSIDLKKLYFLSSFVWGIFGCQVAQADDLAQILSPEKQELFKYQEQINELESDKLTTSWIQPIRLDYSKNFTDQYIGDKIRLENYSITIDQPIFKSGGIYFSIKYADALKGANAADIELSKRQMIGNAVGILFNFKMIKLQQEKMKLIIKNDEIDIKLKQDSFEAGILDISFLDQAIIKRNSDETELLALQLQLEKYQNDFAYLSDKNPDLLETPYLKLISKQNYKNEHLVLKSDTLKAKEKQYYSKMTWSKYLPEVSIKAQYVNADKNPLFANANINGEYTTYGIGVSMPLNINSFADIQSAKVASMQAATQVIDQKKRVELEYQTILNNIRIIDKKIELDHKDEKLYKSLYTVTKNLQHAGEKTSYETEIMRNSLKTKQLDQKIHGIEKQLQLLNLYIKVAHVF